MTAQPRPRGARNTRTEVKPDAEQRMGWQAAGIARRGPEAAA